MSPGFADPRREDALRFAPAVPFVLAVLALACGGNEAGGTGPGPNVLIVSPDTLQFSDCGTAQLLAEVRDGKGEIVPGATFTFASSAAGVVAVNSAGTATAVGEGTATIVVESGGLIVNVPVTITPGPFGIIPSEDSLLLWRGVVDTVTGNLATCRGVLVTPVTPVSFTTTSDPAVATVVNGVVTGHGFGRTTIGWNSGMHSGQYPVRVIGHTLAAAVVATPLSGSPYGVAVTEGGMILVTQIGGTTVATGQLPATALPGSIEVGFQPPHVTVNPAGTRAYVTLQAPESLSVVDLDLGTTTQKVDLAGDGFNLLMMRDGTELFVTTDIGRTYILDANGVKSDSFMVGPASNGVAEHPVLPRVYISSRDAGTVTVYDRNLRIPVDTFMTGGLPQRLAVSPDGNRVYIANEVLGLDIWDAVTGQRIQTVAMPAYGLALSPDGAQLLVTSASSGIRLLDTATLSVTPVLLSGVTRNATYEANGRTAIVTDQTGTVYFLR